MTGRRGLALFLNPYFQLGASAVLLSIAEVLLKQGADLRAAVDPTTVLFGIGALAYASTWIGIVLYVLSFISWLHVLRLMPLSQAYALINVVHVLVPAAAWMFLQERLSLGRLAGIALVFAGTLLVAAPAAKAEDEL